MANRQKDDPSNLECSRCGAKKYLYHKFFDFLLCDDCYYKLEALFKRVAKSKRLKLACIDQLTRFVRDSWSG